MDLLTRVLSLVPVSGVLDKRCHFSAPWEIAQCDAATWVIPYHVVLSGEAVLDGGGPRQRLRAGDVVIFPAGHAHRLHDGSDLASAPTLRQMGELTGALSVNQSAESRVEILCGRFLVGAMPDRLLRDYLPDRLVVRSARPRHHDQDEELGKHAEQAHVVTIPGCRLDWLIELMRDELLDERPGSKTLLGHLSAALFALTLRAASEGPNPPQGLLALSVHTRLQPAIFAMFDHPEQTWTLDQFASICNMSKATFVRQFQRSIGRSATDMLTEVRMTLAGRMLQQSQRSIADVGEHVGYQSVAAFQRVFTRSIGVSPAQYRASAGSTVDA